MGFALPEQFFVERVDRFFRWSAKSYSGGRRHAELSEKLRHYRRHLSNYFERWVKHEASVFLANKPRTSAGAKRCNPFGVCAAVLRKRGSINLLDDTCGKEVRDNSIPLFESFFIFENFLRRLRTLVAQFGFGRIDFFERLLARVPVQFVHSHRKWLSSNCHSFFRMFFPCLIIARRISLGSISMTSQAQTKEYGCLSFDAIHFRAFLESHFRTSRIADSTTRAQRFLSGAPEELSSFSEFAGRRFCILRLSNKKLYQFFDCSRTIWHPVMICDAVMIRPVAKNRVFVVVETNSQLPLTVADSNVEFLRRSGPHLLS